MADEGAMFAEPAAARDRRHRCQNINELDTLLGFACFVFSRSSLVLALFHSCFPLHRLSLYVPPPPFLPSHLFLTPRGKNASWHRVCSGAT